MKHHSHRMAKQKRRDTSSDNMEGSVGSNSNYYFTEEELASKVHSMEVLAYYSALRAFYMCGPLSWEREILLCDLRLYLNISIDEHLYEVKRLCSAEKLQNSVNLSSNRYL
eukprot:TRINITY_DN40091_c0_g1_i1.p1 TRINITY_DN40091_c0_g1~~TRINITY_DN40091_c0_g1_i1.p1  ORF type:complete len:111 (-),score=19.96 TRINITY_DN40091_c0_g1_i1:195-527(-)